MIELQGIRKEFRGQVALDGVTIAIPQGESVAIIGESGAGKSTLARILLRLVEPSAGSYFFEGRDVLRLQGSELKEWRRNIQAVFQNPWQSLNPRLPIDRLVTEPIEAMNGLSRKQRAPQAAELLELVGLSPELGSRYPHQLSGGQRQRIAIARALSTRPRCLVLDEPVSSLDVSVRGQILNLLTGLIQQFGTTVVYVTHDLATAAYVCSRAYVLYQGRVLEQLSTPDLVSKPDNPYTQMLLDSVVTVGEHAKFPPSLHEVADRDYSQGCRFAFRCRHVQTTCLQSEPDLVVIKMDQESRCHFAGGTKPEHMAELESDEVSMLEPQADH